MSIGKFFILAILLPMATIYLTLSLKGERNEFVDVEHHTFSNDENQDLKNDEDIEKTEYSLIDKADDDELLESEKNYSSIEEMIRVKKNKRRTKTVVSRNYSKILNDDDIKYSSSSIVSKKFNNNEVRDRKIAIKKTLASKAKIIPTTITTLPIKEKTKLKPTQVSVINKPVITKKITIKVKKIKIVATKKETIKIKKNKKKFVAIKNKKVKTKIIISKKIAIRKIVTKKKVAAVKAPSKQVKARSKTRPSVFKKQVITKPITATKDQSNAVSTLNNQYFGDLFDDESDNEIGSAEIDEPKTDVEQAQVDTVESDTPKRFSSNPCSGRSARYIARCRKK